MAELKPVNADTLAGRHWTSPQHYGFAADWGAIPLSLAEVYPIASVMPVGFVKKRGHCVPVAIAGQQPARNLFVGPKGQWLGRLVPQALRIHPFQLVKTGDERFVLCVDTDSPCLVAPPASLPFFVEGEASGPLSEILEALKQREADIRGPLAQACAAIEKEGLFEPWPLSFQQENGETVQYNGVYRINSERLNSLNVAELARLYQAQALPLIYAHRLSTYHLHLLNRLAKAHGLGRKEVDLEQLFGEEDDDLTFGS